MGSKRSLAGQICAHISDENPGAPVLDVFSGMCAVGAELAPRHRLLTNDAHSFAKTVAEALFVCDGPPPTSLHARDELADVYAENASALRQAVREELRQEAEVLGRVSEASGWRKLVAFNDAQLEIRVPNLPAPGAKIYQLVTGYFSFGYFGLAQSIELDSLRCAIDAACPERRPYYLSCLLRAASECAASPGHFAQFLVPRDKRTAAYIAKMRTRSILDRFYRALDEFKQVDCADRENNIAYCGDATALLEAGDVSNIDGLVIYADPPYSRAQYSRYYHVLETLVKYDYPDCLGKGRYRTDRFSTGFSLRAKVTEEMRRFAKASSSIGAQLYLSYPTNGLLYKAGSSVEDVLRESYPFVERIASVPLKHSTMGGAPGNASIMVTEDVYRARF
ncbi:DNA adenine methylase [Sphingomonas sp.]|uniref:DNA adenine methylase n=1 Tax=Sphingomonas sp. TaxID=28214 RepID=UPI00345BD9A2